MTIFKSLAFILAVSHCNFSDLFLKKTSGEWWFHILYLALHHKSCVQTFGCGKIPPPSTSAPLNSEKPSTEVEASKLTSETAAYVGKMTPLEAIEAGTVWLIIVALLMKTNDWRRPHHSGRLISNERRAASALITSA